jgi:hypothetical protein
LCSQAVGLVASCKQHEVPSGPRSPSVQGPCKRRPRWRCIAGRGSQPRRSQHGCRSHREPRGLRGVTSRVRFRTWGVIFARFRRDAWRGEIRSLGGRRNQGWRWRARASCQVAPGMAPESRAECDLTPPSLPGAPLFTHPVCSPRGPGQCLRAPRGPKPAWHTASPNAVFRAVGREIARLTQPKSGSCARGARACVSDRRRRMSGRLWSLELLR